MQQEEEEEEKKNQEEMRRDEFGPRIYAFFSFSRSVLSRLLYPAPSLTAHHLIIRPPLPCRLPAPAPLLSTIIDKPLQLVLNLVPHILHLIHYQPPPRIAHLDTFFHEGGVNAVTWFEAVRLHFFEIVECIFIRRLCQTEVDEVVVGGGVWLDILRRHFGEEGVAQRTVRGRHATLEDAVVCINRRRHAEFGDSALRGPSALEVTDSAAGSNHSIQSCDIHRLTGFVHILQGIIRLVNDLCRFQHIHDRLDGG